MPPFARADARSYLPPRKPLRDADGHMSADPALGTEIVAGAYERWHLGAPLSPGAQRDPSFKTQVKSVFYM